MKLRHLRFGIFFLISAGLTLWIGGQIVGYEGSTSRIGLTARFEDATNLRAGDPVRLAGVPVGRVTDVAIDQGQAAVEFSVDDDIPLPVDTEVAVRAQNLLGVRELVLTPGESTTMFADGDTVTNASSSVDLGALINELGPFLEAVSPDQLNTLITALNQTVAGNRATVAGLTSDLVLVLDTFGSRADTIGQLVTDYDTLTGELARRDGQIQQLLDNLVLLTETFDASDDVLIAALEELPGFTAELADLLETNAGALDSLLADLSSVTGDLTAELDLVDETVGVLPAGLRSLFGVANQGELLVTNYLCTADGPPPCPHPLTDGDEGAPTLEDVLEELMGP